MLSGRFQRTCSELVDEGGGVKKRGDRIGNAGFDTAIGSSQASCDPTTLDPLYKSAS